MSIDLSKLTPVPWAVRHGTMDSTVFCGSENPLDADCGFNLPNRDDAEFIALSRNAFDVMLRRGWGVALEQNDSWTVRHAEPGSVDPVVDRSWPDPFTALVEADAWYKASIEGRSS